MYKFENFKIVNDKDFKKEDIVEKDIATLKNDKN